jgi:glycerol-3-phosphate acyltransferase PlsY
MPESLADAGFLGPASALVLAYLLGSLSGSLILGRIRQVDIRQRGSGNAGGTNALRTLGWRFALGVVLIDVGKGVAAALVPTWLGIDMPLLAWLEVACMMVAAAGHVWPVFFGFRGGKGAGTLVGGLAVVWPSALGVVLVTWLLVLFASGYVGLATILAALSLLLVAAWEGTQAGALHWALALAGAGFITWTHRANIVRLREGRESRFEKIRLFARLRWLARRRGGA